MADADADADAVKKQASVCGHLHGPAVVGRVDSSTRAHKTKLGDHPLSMEAESCGSSILSILPLPLALPLFPSLMSTEIPRD